MSDIRTGPPPEVQEWIQRRIAAVRESYSAYRVLTEKNIEVPDESTPYQIACPFHGADNRPSARYYPREGGKHDYVRCFKCRENWDCINLQAKFNGIRFMDSLQDLERRFHIKIPKKPDAPEFTDPVDRDSNYVSDLWKDVPRQLKMLESMLGRIRPKCGLSDYIKFCRVLDTVQWDFDKTNKSSPAMVDILKKLRDKMFDIVELPDDLAFL